MVAALAGGSLKVETLYVASYTLVSQNPSMPFFLLKNWYGHGCTGRTSHPHLKPHTKQLPNMRSLTPKNSHVFVSSLDQTPTRVSFRNFPKRGRN